MDKMKPNCPPPAEAVKRHLADISATGTLELRTERGREPCFCVRFRVANPDGGPRRQRRIAIGDDAESHRLVRGAITDRTIKRLSAKSKRGEEAAARKRERDNRYGGLGRLINSRRKGKIYERAKKLAARHKFPIVLMLITLQIGRKSRGGRPLKSRLW